MVLSIRQFVLPRSLLLLLTLGIIDLVSTAVLHSQGMIVELNPLMRPLIEQSEWLFAFVKGLTLVVGGGMLAWYAQSNREFVERTCWIGTGAYALIWCLWFFGTK